MIYLDNAATTFPKSEGVYAALDRANRQLAFNAGRGSYGKAREVTEFIDNTKQQLLKLVNAPYGCSVVFTSSITIALNQILQGIDFKVGENIYVSPYEHNAVARTVHLLELEKRINVIEMPINAETLEIDVDKLKYQFSTNPPRCVCCIHISNVTGYVLPVKDIFESARKYDAITVLDTAQSLGIEQLDTNDMNISFLAFAGHKSLYGPLGVGGFIDFGKVYLKNVIVGGTGSNSLVLGMPEQSPSKYESSSCNIVAIAGLKAALDEVNILEVSAVENELLDYLIEHLKNVDGVKMYLPPREKHSSILSVNLEGYKADDVGTILDSDFDIAVRTGYHCAPFIHKWLKDEEYLGTVRIGIGRFNTKTDIDAFVAAVKGLCEE